MARGSIGTKRHALEAAEGAHAHALRDASASLQGSALAPSKGVTERPWCGTSADPTGRSRDDPQKRRPVGRLGKNSTRRLRMVFEREIVRAAARGGRQRWTTVAVATMVAIRAVSVVPVTV